MGPHQPGTAAITAKSDTIADNLRFLRALIQRPKNIGAVFPSGPALTRAIASQFDPEIPGPILELGPGTGVVTAALIERGFAPERLTVIEFDPEFAAGIRRRFHGVHVIEGDAFDLARTLGAEGPRFAGIISGLPLLNFPLSKRNLLIEGAMARLQPGGPLVQFSYGLEPPVRACSRFKVARAATVWANLPPARIWLYSPAR